MTVNADDLSGDELAAIGRAILPTLAVTRRTIEPGTEEVTVSFTVQAPDDATDTELLSIAARALREEIATSIQRRHGAPPISS